MGSTKTVPVHAGEGKGDATWCRQECVEEGAHMGELAQVLHGCSITNLMHKML
jgi:hypothetical protein